MGQGLRQPLRRSDHRHRQAELGPRAPDLPRWTPTAWPARCCCPTPFRRSFRPRPNITISLPRTREDFEQRWAGVQAHNRWQIDFCSLAPARRRGLIQIFPNDVELALEEIRWGVEQGCFGGVLIPAVSPGDPHVAPLFHTRYEPIWALCAGPGPDGGAARGRRQPRDADGSAGVQRGVDHRDGARGRSARSDT